MKQWETAKVLYRVYVRVEVMVQSRSIEGAQADSIGMLKAALAQNEQTRDACPQNSMRPISVNRLF